MFGVFLDFLEVKIHDLIYLVRLGNSENTRSHSDLDIYAESSCALCTQFIWETWSKPRERARKLKKALAHWTRNPNCASGS
jgi:hypothetical protein